MEIKNLGINDPILGIRVAKRKISIGLNIYRYTTNANGEILANSAVPANMAVAYPFHLFGEFDRQGGFRVADQTLQSINNTKLFSVYIWGINTPLFYFNPLSNVTLKFQKGDLIFVYVDDLIAPNYFTFVQISATDGAYGSIISQTMVSQLSQDTWGAFKMFELQMVWDADQQLNEIFYPITTTFDSRFNKNTIEPFTYYDPQYIKQKKIIIPWETIINQYSGLSGFIAFESNLLNLQIIIYV